MQLSDKLHGCFYSLIYNSFLRSAPPLSRWFAAATLPATLRPLIAGSGHKALTICAQFSSVRERSTTVSTCAVLGKRSTAAARTAV